MLNGRPDVGSVTQPMSLGDHLDELRQRLVRVIIVLAVTMVGAAMFHAELLQVMLLPLRRGAELVSDQVLADLGQLRAVWLT